MTTSRAAALLRVGGEPERATFLELFFDLVFVFALTRVSQQAVLHLTAPARTGPSGTGQPLLLLLALLMVWYATTTVTDVYDPQRPEIQLVAVAPALVPRPPHIAAVPPVAVLTGVAIADAVRARRHPLPAPVLPGQ